MKSINWNQASELGLIERINNEILHPLGLAMTRNPKTGLSEGLLISDDGVWKYCESMQLKPVLSPNQIQRQIKEFKNDLA